MTTSSGNFPELLWPGIDAIWGHVYNDWPLLYPKFMDVRKSTMRFEKQQGVTGLGLASVKNEGSSVEYSDPYQGYQKEYVNVTYGLGTCVTREMYEDDMYNYINDLPKFLARSMRKTEETVAANHLNRAFNSSYLGADGIQLLSGGGSGGTAHPLVAGGTFRNELTTSADLTQTSLEQALMDIDDFVDDNNLEISVKARCLVIPTQLRMRAHKLLNSSLVTGSADNDVNPLNGLFSNDALVVSPYLSDTDAWFICTDVDHGLTFFNRRDAEITRDNEFDTENLKFKTTKRFVSGWTNPRGVFGSQGA